jgi:TonB family protein
MKMKNILVSALLLFTVSASAQNNEPTSPSRVYAYVDQMPKAGYDYNKYLNGHIHYPDTARKHKIQGRVIIKFIVNEDGSISDCQVMRGIGGGCDDEALRVVRSFPRWKPGLQDGKPVKVYFTLPIVFKLDEKGDANSLYTASPQNTGTTQQVYAYVDKMPQAGYDYNEYIARNINYPDAAQKNKVEGRVIIKFIVNEDGSISDGMVVRGIGSGCDDEAIRVIQKMPTWKPGSQNGKAVKVYYTMPIVFKL